ncbi:MAG: AraC family transcriptional regulator [Anaerolineaceae bacterium]|nr:AraC family transcriptional regulator [Anaerolineaceae bacterium]
MHFVFDTHSPLSSYIDMIWHMQTERAESFLSTAAVNWEIVFTQIDNKMTIGVRGPETKASLGESTADADYFGITFKLGTFMPNLPLQSMLNRQDVVLPLASTRSFWLLGSKWEVPTFDNADVFINRLLKQEILTHDPVVTAALQGETPDLSPRALQYRFQRATGISQKMIQQIERARQAAVLLEQGKPILDTTYDLGYFDQAHLTNSLKRFIGETPTEIAEQVTRKSYMG